MSGAQGTPRPLRLDTLGLNERMRQRFELLFKSTGRGLAVFVNATVAEAVIVDLDQGEARRDWPEYRRAYPDRPAVVLSLQPQDLEPPHQFLPKPIEIRALLQALARLRNCVESGAAPAATGAGAAKTLVLDAAGGAHSKTLALEPHTEVLGAPPGSAGGRSGPVCAVPGPLRIARDDVEALQAHWLDPEGHLLGAACAWARGLEQSSRASVLRWAGLWLLFDPRSCKLGCNLDREALQAACLLPCEATEVQVHSPGAEELDRYYQEVATSWPEPQAAVWDLALWTYQGKLPLGTLIDQRVYLKYWPNLTRLSPLPDAMRIAALWAEQPLSIASLAETLQLPLERVFSFYSACHSIGLADSARREADLVFRTAPVPAIAERDLFGRVLSRLRGLLRPDQEPPAEAPR